MPDQIPYYDLMALGTWLDTNFAIIIQMRRDRRNGGHPALRIIRNAGFPPFLLSLLI